MQNSPEGSNTAGLIPSPTSGSHGSLPPGCSVNSAACSSSMYCAGDFSPDTVPYTNRGVERFSYRNCDAAHSTSCGIFDTHEPWDVHSAIGPNHCPIITETFNPDSHRALHQVLHKESRKNRKKVFALPDSLARSFDSSEMDQIANAIVRVNKYGLSSVASKSGFSPFMHTSSRVLPSVGAFTVQCANCFKWRLIPSKEEYEQIRQNILEKPFFCTSWRAGATCDDPPELGEDSGLLWAIDKPNIPCPPDGWERLLVIRGEGSYKFSDIYYVSPFGKRLRSMPEIERYLSENPELVDKGASLTLFSFTCPKALDESYCKKRSNEMRGSISQNMIQSNACVPESLQSRVEQSSTSFTENAALSVEPLRSWAPSLDTLMICHQAGEVEAPGSV